MCEIIVQRELLNAFSIVHGIGLYVGESLKCSIWLVDRPWTPSGRPDGLLNGMRGAKRDEDHPSRGSAGAMLLVGRVVVWCYNRGESNSYILHLTIYGGRSRILLGCVLPAFTSQYNGIISKHTWYCIGVMEVDDQAISEDRISRHDQPCSLSSTRVDYHAYKSKDGKGAAICPSSG